MKRTILTLVAGLVIGGATLGPLAAQAVESATLRERVSQLEYRLDTACQGAKVVEPVWFNYLKSRGAC